MSSQSAQTAGHAQRRSVSIPQFAPLPPTSLLNRLINKILAPLFYLLFTIVTAVVVVPLYTVIDQFKHGRNAKGGARVHRDETPGREGQSQGRSQARDFLRAYARSYKVSKDGSATSAGTGVGANEDAGGTAQRTTHHHHHQQQYTSDETHADTDKQT